MDAKSLFCSFECFGYKSVQSYIFESRLLKQNDIYWEVVAVAAHPDAAAEGAERIAVVASAVLLEEFLVMHLGVLELISRVVGGQ